MTYHMLFVTTKITEVELKTKIQTMLLTQNTISLSYEYVKNET